MYLFEQRDLKFSQRCVDVSSLGYDTVSLGVLLPGLRYFTLIMYYGGSNVGQRHSVISQASFFTSLCWWICIVKSTNSQISRYNDPFNLKRLKSNRNF